MTKGAIHLVLIPAIALAVIGVFVVLKNSPPEPIVTPTSPPTPTLTSTSSPPPFQELTIPYLQNRAYKSSLGELIKHSESANYTSYLTNYYSDGLKINGLLTIPKEGGQRREEGWPAIVFVHGYIPPIEYKTTQNYAAYVDYLAKNGFVVFKIDLRGHGDSDGEPGGAYYSEDYVVDTLNAHAALQSADFVNPNAIGLWGHSMAGNVVFRSFVVKRSIPAIAIWAGAVYTYEDMRQFGINDNSYQPPSEDSPVRKKREELTKTHGPFAPDSDFWKQVVPTNYLDGVSGSVSLHHAVNDNVVSINYSRNLVSVLERSKINVQLNEYPSGGHNISGSAFSAAMQDTVEFFRSELE